MKKKYNLWVFLSVIFFISGCSSLIFTDKQAPAYKSPSDKKKGLAYDKTPGILTSSSSTKSIEKPTDDSVQIVTSSNNPYEDTYSDGYKNESVYEESDQRFLNQTESTVTAIEDKEGLTNPYDTEVNVPSVEDEVDDFVDPRIKDAKDILGDDNIALRPESSQRVEEVITDNESVIEAEGKKISEKVNKSNSLNTPKADDINDVKKDISDKTNAIEKDLDKEVVKVKETTEKKEEPVSSLSAVDSLLTEAQQAVIASDYEKASSALERAHRIDPSNAKILYDISQIKYVQGNYQQAESFAGRAANLSKDRGLSKKTWLLIADARRAQGNESGADLATKRANNY